MYRCKDCRYIFDKPVNWFEARGLDVPPYEELKGCPQCLGHDYVEAIQCDCCAKYIDDKFIEVKPKFYLGECCYVIESVEDLE